MKPELESLAQQLIEAGEKATPGEWSFGAKNGNRDITLKRKHWELGINHGVGMGIIFGDDESNAAYIALANPANITAVILAFRDELAQGKSEHGKTLLLLNQAAFETIPKLEEELKQARRDALVEVIELVHIAVPPTWNGSTRDAIEKAIRALMEKP